MMFKGNTGTARNEYKLTMNKLGLLAGGLQFLISFCNRLWVAVA